MLPKPGTKAPTFALPDQSGEIHRLKDYAGRWVAFYFYPKDDTPGCTVEACAFRDSHAALRRAGAAVLGVSADPVKRHAKFAEKYRLPFALLADEEKKTLKAYGVWAKKKFMGREYMGILRTTFLIDPKGVIARVYENVKPSEHVEEILKDLNTLKK